MKTFNIGDKVAYYGSIGREIATVVNNVPDEYGCIKVTVKHSIVDDAHPKQLRKLVKPITFYAALYSDNSGSVFTSLKEAQEDLRTDNGELGPKHIVKMRIVK